MHDWLSRRLATVLAETPASESDLTARVVGANPADGVAMLFRELADRSDSCRFRGAGATFDRSDPIVGGESNLGDSGLIGKQLPLAGPSPDLVEGANGRCLSLARPHQLDVVALKRDHLRRRVRASRRVHRVAGDDQPAALAGIARSQFVSASKIGLPHPVLQCLRFKRTTINDRLALDVFVDTMADSFDRLFRMSKLDVAALARVREMTLDFDSILLRA